MTERENQGTEGETKDEAGAEPSGTEEQISVRTVMRQQHEINDLKRQIRHYEFACGDMSVRLRDAELGVRRERFIRILAMQLAQEILPAPAKFDLNEKGAFEACWALARALWDAKPEDC